ncbi:hypothetical protein [Streptomyces sp. NBC_01443]|uniref:hypothetical protein n=1 Tax=Streptomyces sp. NBC_01443 TaxID=2903868 RepID=UPI00224E60D5|nr:hypothetical protein [Streptomyces sp. NBC_01443]MCX4629449.1 hypothetical protein [Streptomyces sp. NBC_01443]
MALAVPANAQDGPFPFPHGKGKGSGKTQVIPCGTVEADYVGLAYRLEQTPESSFAFLAGGVVQFTSNGATTSGTYTATADNLTITIVIGGVTRTSALSSVAATPTRHGPVSSPSPTPGSSSGRTDTDNDHDGPGTRRCRARHRSC